MANRSYLNLEDELKDEDNSSSDPVPYSSISNRDKVMQAIGGKSQGLASSDDSEDISAPSAPVSPAIRVPSIGSQAPDDYSKDPLMQSFEKDQSNLEDLRKAQIGANTRSNIGLALSNAARGSQAPITQNDLYGAIDSQNKSLVNDASEDANRRRMVINAIEQRKSREDIAKNNQAQRSMQAQLLNSQKQDAASAKMATALKDDLDPNKARAGNLALNQKRIDNADRVQALLSQVNNNPDPRQMEELAISTQALLSSSGSPAAEQVKALIPHTAQGNANALKEWLTNNPTGTGQQEFVKRMADTVQREKDVAQGQVRVAQRQRLAAHGRLKQTDPDTYNSIINSYGLNDKPQAQPEAQSSGPKAGDVEDGHRFKGGNPADPNNWEAI